MATAEELLAATGATDQILFIDLNTRTIKIPGTVLNLGVMADDDVKRIYFQMPKQYGEFDLSIFDIRVNYMNAGKYGGIYVSNDATVDESTGIMTFSWLIDRHVVEYSGRVTFNVCLKLLDSNGVAIQEFNTTTAGLDVLTGLEPEEALVEENPSAFDCVLARLYAIEVATGLGHDGYYNVVRVEETDDGVIITVVDQNGETQAILKDGYVPVRGTDYWTNEDQTIIRNYIDTWAPRAVTVTLSPAGWNNYTQTVSVEGVTKDSILMVVGDPNDTNYEYYVGEEVKCIGQADGTLTFGCSSMPSVPVVASIAIFYNKEEISGIASVTDDGNGNVYIT